MERQLMQWFNQIDLDPATHPVSMGTRALGQRPWLVADDKRDAELALKRDLLANKRDQVFHTTPKSLEPASEVVELIRDTGVDVADRDDVHPLERAATAVQEDLVLLDRGVAGWYFDSAALCFPTRWSLTEKIGKHITAVHGPVDEYQARIAQRVDRLFDRVNDRPVWRRNWFLMTNPDLFQPYPTPIDTLQTHDIEHGMFVRSERQTLRLLPSDWLLFTIRIQQAPLSQLLDATGRFDDFARWVRDVPVDTSPQRHLFPEQRTVLLEALDQRTSTGSWPSMHER